MAKIHLLELQNFGKHENTSIDLGQTPVHVFVGENEQGKSQILEGLRWNLTGVCRLTDERGAGADRIIRHGASGMNTHVVLTHKGSSPVHVWREKGRQGSAGFKATSSQTITDDSVFLAHLGMSKRMISAALSVGYFFDMDAKARNKLVLSLFGGQMTKEEIGVEVRKHLSSKLAIAGFEQLLGRLGKGPYGPEVLQLIHDEAYKKRTDVNRELADAKAVDRATDTDRPAAKEIPQLKEKRDAAQTQLRTLSSAQESFLVQKTKLAEQINAYTRQLAELDSKGDLGDVCTGCAHCDGCGQKIPETSRQARRDLIIKEAKALKGKITRATNKVEEIDAEGDKLAEQQRTATEQYENAVKLLALAEQETKDIEAIQAKQKALDELVKTFSPKGPMAGTLILDQIKGLVTTTNVRLGAMTSKALGLVMDHEGNFRVRRDYGDGKYVDDQYLSLSESEEYRVGVVLADALAFASGLGILAIDNADRLYGVRRVQFRALMPLWAQTHETTLIFAAGDASSPSTKHMTVWKVENGTVTANPRLS